MATYDPAVIRAQIKTLLQTATEIQNVYDYNNPNIEGYPAIIFDMTNEESSMLDDSNNLRTLTFTAYLVVEVSVKTQVQAKDILDTATKSVINILEKKTNDTLSGNVDWVMPVVGRRQQIDSPEGAVLWQEISIKVNVSSTIL